MFQWSLFQNTFFFFFPHVKLTRDELFVQCLLRVRSLLLETPTQALVYAVCGNQHILWTGNEMK